MTQILRTIFRRWSRRPGPACAAVACGALGLGLAIALVAIANAIWFRPLPVENPDEILRVYSASDLHPLGFVSYPDYLDLARDSRLNQGLVAQTQVLLTVGAAEAASEQTTPQVRMGMAVTLSYFALLRVGPLMGRTLQQSDASQPLIVLSERFWESNWPKGQAVLGKTIMLAGTPFTIIGVMPRGFGLDKFLHEDFYVSMDVYKDGVLPSNGRPWEDRGRRYLSVYARAANANAAAELGSLGEGLAAQFPETNHGLRVVALNQRSARKQDQSSISTAAMVLMALALVGFLGACVTMAALLLIESEGHAHEAALKIALGAQTGRLLIEALLHSALLVSASVLIAIPVALAGLRLLENMTAPADGIAVFFDARLDHQTLLAGLIAATLLIPICALPVWWASGGRTHRPFANSRIARASRWPGLVLVGQTTLAAMLSAIALYSLLGLREAKHLDWGYRTNHLLLAVFDPSQVHYDKARTKAFYDQLLQRARRLPGVTDASIAQSIPLGFTGAQKTLMLGGRKVGLWMNTVSPGHFKQMRIQLQAGREFDLSDGESSERTVIVNERMRELWPDQIAVGRSIEVEGLNREIVGIARTVKYANWNESKRPFIYLPFSQNYTPRMTLLLEVTGAPTEITRSLRGLVRELDPAQPVSGITTFEQQINRGALYTARLALAISSAASLVVLLLSFFGVYASATAAAGRERKQTGIRKALGAPVLTLAWQAIKGVAIAASLGTLTGSILALFLASWTGKLVPGTSVAALAISAVGGSAFVLLSSLMASLWPALRASSEEACSLLAVAKN